MKVFRIVAVIMFLAFIGCARVDHYLFTPGDKPDAVPPKIQILPDNTRIWDRPLAFGPVPAEMQENGKQACGPQGLKAVGYHPNAQDENGKPFQGGGFLCAPIE